MPPPTPQTHDWPDMPGTIWAYILLGMALGVLWTVLLGLMVFVYRPSGWRNSSGVKTETKKKKSQGVGTKSRFGWIWRNRNEGKGKGQRGTGDSDGNGEEEAIELQTLQRRQRRTQEIRVPDLQTLRRDAAFTSATPRGLNQVYSEGGGQGTVAGLADAAAVPSNHNNSLTTSPPLPPSPPIPRQRRRRVGLPAPPPPSPPRPTATDLATATHHLPPFSPPQLTAISLHEHTSPSAAAAGSRHSLDNPLLPPRHLLHPRSSAEYLAAYREFFGGAGEGEEESGLGSSLRTEEEGGAVMPETERVGNPFEAGVLSGSEDEDEDSPQQDDDDDKGPTTSVRWGVGKGGRVCRPPAAAAGERGGGVVGDIRQDAYSSTLSTSPHDGADYVSDVPVAAADTDGSQDLEAQIGTLNPRANAQRRILSDGRKNVDTGPSASSAPSRSAEERGESVPPNGDVGGNWSGKGLLEAVDGAVGWGVDKVVRWTEQGGGEEEGLLLPLRD